MSDGFYAFFYQKLLDNYGKFLPKCFLFDGDISKDSLKFRIYIKILEIYIYTLKSVEQRGLSFSIKLQERRLQKILAIANTTKWWQSYFTKNKISVKKIKSLADFKEMPPVNRFNLLDVAKEDILTCSSTDSSILWCQTSGSTTGTPFVWGLNKTITIVDMLAHAVKELGGNNFSLKKDGLKNFHMTFNFPRSDVLRTFRWFSSGNFFLKSDDKNLGDRIREISKIITHLNKAVIQCNPNELKFLVDTLKDYNLHPPVLCFYILGQTLEEPLRRLVTEYFKCQIIARYGTQETGALAMECRNHHGFYHVFSEHTIVEILDDMGQTVSPDTAGNITVTCLDNTVMPLIRYQPGDIGILHYDLSCGCENKSPLLEIKGRDTDVIEFSNGTKKPAGGILRRFYVEPFIYSVRRFQVRQDELDEVKILLEVRAPIDEEAIQALKKRVSTTYNGMLKKISVEQTNAIYQDGPKFKVFVPLKKKLAVTA